jgi:hypothetical protein
MISRAWTAVILIAIWLPPTGSLAADSCEPELGEFRLALEAIRTEYPSHKGRISLNEVEEFARSELPRQIKRECLVEIERIYPSQTLRLAPARGGLSFYEEAEDFSLGFHISDCGQISEVYAKVK